MVERKEIERLLSLLPKKLEDLSTFLPGVVYRAFSDNQFLFLHTLSVVSWSRKLNEVLELGLDSRLVEITAWLHDIGQIEGHEGHAERGASWVSIWLGGVASPEEMELILDGIRNHGTSSEPNTPMGHLLRFSDALGVWDPFIVGWALYNASCEEIKQFKETQMTKKLRVIREYWKRWPRSKDHTQKPVEITEKILKQMCY